MNKYSTTKTLKVRTSFKGTHNWPEATQFAGELVGFLEARHRHTFHLQAELKVSHSDREVEFFIFQSQVEGAIQKLYSFDGIVYNLGRRSCETIAEEIISYLRDNYNYNFLAMEVWEDNEVGARIESRPTYEVKPSPLTPEELELLD